MTETIERNATVATAPRQPRLMDRVHESLRAQHYALITERTYCQWEPCSGLTRHFASSAHFTDAVNCNRRKFLNFPIDSFCESCRIQIKEARNTGQTTSRRLAGSGAGEQHVLHH